MLLALRPWLLLFVVLRVLAWLVGLAARLIRLAFLLLLALIRRLLRFVAFGRPFALPVAMVTVPLLLAVRGVGELTNADLIELRAAPLGWGSLVLREAVNGAFLVVAFGAVLGAIVALLLERARAREEPGRLPTVIETINRDPGRPSLLLVLTLLTGLTASGWTLAVVSDQSATFAVAATALLVAWGGCPRGGHPVPEELLRLGASAEEFLRAVREAPFYGGQICRVRALSATPPKSFESAEGGAGQAILPGAAEFWLGSGPLVHQGQVLERTAAEFGPAAVMLSTAVGSGRTGAVILAIVNTVFSNGQRVLCVVPDRRRAESLHRRLARVLNAGGSVKRLVHIASIPAGAHDGAAIEESDVLIVDYEALHSYFLREHRRFSVFLEELGLVVLTHVDEPEPPLAANVTWLIRRLRLVCRQYRSDPRFVLHSGPLSHGLEHARALTGMDDLSEESIIAGDGQGTKRRVLVFWTPSLDVDPANRDQTRRRPFADDVRKLVSVGAQMGFRPAVIIRSPTYTGEDLLDLSTELSDLVAREARLPESIPVANSTDALEPSIKEYDMCIFIGVPVPASQLMHETDHIGLNTHSKSAVVIVVAAQRPAEQLAVRSPDHYITNYSRAGPAVANVDVEPIRQRHLACAVLEGPVALRDLELFFGNTDVRAEELRRVSGLEVEVFEQLYLQDDSLKPVRLARAGNEGQSLSAYQQVSLRATVGPPLEIVDLATGATILTADMSERPELAQRGTMIRAGATRLEVERTQPTQMRLDAKPVTGASAVATVPLLDLRFPAPEKEYRLPLVPVRIGGGRRFRMWRGPLRVEKRAAGLRLLLDHNLQYYDQYKESGRVLPGATKHRESVLDIEYSPDALVIVLEAGRKGTVSSEALRSVASLLRSALPLVVGALGHQLLVLPVVNTPLAGGRPTIILAERQGGGTGAAAAVEAQLERLLTAAFDIAQLCPCTEGCSACAIDPEDPEPLLPPPPRIDKRNAILILGSLVGRSTEAKRVVRDVYEKVKDPDRLTEIVGEVADNILGDRLDLRFSSRVVTRFMTKREESKYANLLGLFDGEKIIVRRLPLGQLIDVVAHEWAHVWEIREGHLHPVLMDPVQVPFRGLLFVEGFAQWVAFKVMDFYGLRQHMKHIQTWRYSEYGDGFQIIKWLEQRRGGVRGVLDFCSSGQYPGGLEQLYYDSGTAQRIAQLRALLESGELPEPPSDFVEPEE